MHILSLGRPCFTCGKFLDSIMATRRVISSAILPRDIRTLRRAFRKSMWQKTVRAIETMPDSASEERQWSSLRR